VRSLREKRGTSGPRSLRAKTRNLRAAEPPHLLAEIMCLGFPSARFEIRL
jgi:hypothetical protein